MPRLFAAIALDRAARDRIAAAEQQLIVKLEGASLRWVRPEHLHVTMVFLGEVSEDSAATVVQVMHREIPRPPFQIGLGGFGVFPARGAPRALWLGVRTGLDAVIALQEILTARLAAHGFSGDRRRFSPHLTLARWRGRGGQPAQRPLDLGASYENIATVDVNDVTLFQSRLSSEGPSYVVLAESPLTGTHPSVH